MSQTGYCTSEPVYSPNARELAIATAHEENINMQQHMIAAIDVLSGQINSLVKEIGWLSGKLKFPPQGGTQ